MGELSNFIKRFKVKLEQNNFKINNIKEINYGFQIEVSSNINNKIKFNIYFSRKKGFSLVFSNSATINSDYKNYKEKITVIFNNLIFKGNDDLYVIGADEAGKGDYFGPLVLAAVYINEDFKNELVKFRLKESKFSNDKQIVEFYNKIKQFSNNFEIKVLDCFNLNKLYSEKKQIGKNLNNILDEYFYEIVYSLIRKVEKNFNYKDKNNKKNKNYKKNIDNSNSNSDSNVNGDYNIDSSQLSGIHINRIIIDKFGKVEKILLLDGKYKNIELLVEEKAEKYLSVLVASLIAKAVYLIELNKLSMKYEIDFHKGASDLVLKEREIFLKKYNKNDLEKVAKVFFNFKNKLL